MAVVKIVPMPGPTGATGPAGSGNGVSSTVPFNLYDTNEDLLLSITKSGTGTTRVTAPQDDLALRSARDIILYPGDDGPGKVYINWGDADINPDATNEVATLADINDAIASANLGDIKTRIWEYPSENAVAIMPSTDGESIALKSSDAAAIRWHVRNNGASGNSIDLLSATVTAGEGYEVVFTIPEQDSVPPTGEYFYQIASPNSTGFEGAFFATDATTTTLTFYYSEDPGVFDATDASVYPPSVYSQFEVDSSGAHVKIADWSAGQGSYSYYWNFQNNGAIEFPNQSSNNRTGNGEVLKFGNPTTQSIITGAAPYYESPTAQRIVIAGQDGVAGDGYDGEGGDVYLWAGQGGGTGGNGGDIKIDAGNGATDGTGGYVKIRGGDSTTANGGFVEIIAGESVGGNGGDITINAGQSTNGEGTSGGDVNINAGYSSSSWAGGHINLSTTAEGKITLNGAGGEFLNDSSVPGNQIATVSDLGEDTSFTVVGGTLTEDQPTFDGDPLFTGSYVKTGPMVHFRIDVDMDNITDFGSGQYYLDLPFPAKYNHLFRNACLHDVSMPRQYGLSGHVEAGQSRMLLFYTDTSGQDYAFDYNSPALLTVNDNFHIAGDYIMSAGA